MNKCDGALHDSDGDWEPKEKKSRKSSKVWEYFECLSKEHARCRICFQKLSYKTTISNLKKHVINRHSKRDLNSSPQDKGIDLDETILLSPQEDAYNSSETPKKYKNNYSKKEPLPSYNPLLRFVSSGDNDFENDEYDAYGIIVASRLRRMEERQRLFCEKIINDAVFKGTLNQLTPISDIVICIPATTS